MAFGNFYANSLVSNSNNYFSLFFIVGDSLKYRIIENLAYGMVIKLDFYIPDLLHGMG